MLTVIEFMKSRGNYALLNRGTNSSDDDITCPHRLGNDDFFLATELEIINFEAKKCEFYDKNGKREKNL